MRSLMWLMSVAVVVMTADAYNSRARSDRVGVDRVGVDSTDSKLRLLELYQEIDALQAASERSSSLFDLETALSRSSPSDQDKRINNFFNRFNVVNPVDGVIDADDISAVLQAVFSVQPEIAEGCKQYVITSVNLMFQYYFKDIATSVDKFRDSIKAEIASDTFTGWATGVFPVFFQAVDVSSDGKLSKDEYTRIYNKLFPDSSSYADSSYRAMATRDGSLTLCDYVAYATTYFTSTKTGASHDWWGKY